jgi:capsular polysaccharide transport system permease protein
VAVSNMPRPPLTVTFAVWKALFLREAVHRMSRERAASLWMVVEPVVHVVVILFLFAVLRARIVVGIDLNIWLMVGITFFFMFRRTFTQTMNAVGNSQALYTYRQVKPVDAALVRAAVEGFLMALVMIILLAGVGLYGVDVVADDPLKILLAVLGMWLFGLGFGLIASVAVEMIPELGTFLALVVQPLYFLSGVFFPIANIPQPYRDWLLFIPTVHGLELGRQGFSTSYHSLPEVSAGYLYGASLVCVLLGLALHRRFATRLTAR